MAREIFSNSNYAVGQVVGLECRRPQPLHGITAFRNRRSRLIECALQSLPGFLWAFGKYLQDRLEPEQQSLKTLQQSVVQFARNACALTHPRFEGHIELVGELTACIVQRLCQDRQLVISENL